MLIFDFTHPSLPGKIQVKSSDIQVGDLIIVEKVSFKIFNQFILSVIDEAGEESIFVSASCWLNDGFVPNGQNGGVQISSVASVLPLNTF